MTADERRTEILNLLKSTKKPVTGNELAEKFDVTRQVIVQDIAILRALGNDIVATARGYIASQAPLLNFRTVVAVKHSESETREELMIFIKCGCKVLDVIVEHAIYGELHGLLLLQTAEDIDEFLLNLKESNSALLSQLTQGVHLHTVEALNEESVKMAKNMLRKKGFLLE